MLVDRGGRGRLVRAAPGVFGATLIAACTVVACAVALGIPSAPNAAAAGPGSGRERLPGHQGLVPPGATLLGPAPTTTALPLVVTLKPRDPAALAAEVKAVSDPGSPEYHHFLTPSQFAQRYGASPATIAQVAASLEQEGLTVGTPSATGLSLPVSSTVGQAQSAFGTSISKYRLASGKTGYDNSAAPEVPSTVAPQIQGVLGLDTLSPPQPSTSVPGANPGSGQPSAVAAPTTLAPGQPAPPSTGPCADNISNVQSTYDALDAPELAQAYSFGSLYSSGDYGAGQTIALVEMAGAGYVPNDISTFAGCYGITIGPTQLTSTPVASGAGGLGPGTEEAELDIETALSLAPQANIDVYEGGTSSSLYDVFSKIVSDDSAKVVSASWTNGCEAYVGQSLQSSENTLFQAAAAEGQSVFVATGDQGSQGCNINAEISASTGSNPLAQAVDPSTSTLYVANKGSNTVSVISEGNANSPASFVNAGSVHTGSQPDAVALDASDRKVFVANSSGSLTVIPTSGCNQSTISGCNTPTQITSGHLAAPAALAVSGSTLYVGNGDGTVALYNASTNAFVTTVTLPVGSVATAVAVDSTNGFVYVADGANNRVAYFDATTCNATTTTGCASTPSTVGVQNDPVALTISGGAGDLYVANAGGGGGVSVISLSTHALVTTISTSQPGNGTGVVQSIGLSPDGNEVLAVLNGLVFPGDVLATINTSTQAITSTVALETGTDNLGQLVSDGTLDYVWVTDATSGRDVIENLNLAVTDPASQPYVTAVGGTSLGHGTPTLGPPPTEQVWNDALHYSDGAGGGGISKTFTMPAYQQSLGTVSGSSGLPCAATGSDCREIPDVAADADPSSGYVIFDSHDGLNWSALGGTSAAAPLWAAVIAVVASADGNATGYGALNPALYLLAEQSPGTYLNDVTVGNNDYNATDGGSYPALPGYDMATGLGTPVVSALATGLTTIPLPVAVSGTQTYGGSPTFSGFANFAGPGTTPPGVSLDTSALVCTTVGNFTTISSTLTPGGYTLQAASCSGGVLSGPNQANYTIVYTSAANDFTVTPIPVEVAVTGTQTYGSTPSFSGTDAPPSGVAVDTSGLTCSQAGQSTIAPTMPAGSYTITAQSCSGATLSGNATNYGVVYTSAANDFSVTTAPLTVTALPSTMQYGGAPATVTPGYSGFVNSDSSSSLTTRPTCSTTATPTSTVLGGPYVSSCSGAVDPNYAIGYVNGTTTITPAPMAISVSGSQANGGSPQFSGSGNLPSGVTIDASALTCSQVNPSTTITGALYSGSYTLVASTCSGAQLTGPSASNYFPTYASSSGDFTVTGGPVPPAPPTPATPARTDGYWLVGSDGGIFTFGSAQFYGSTGSLVLQRPVVGISPTADRAGYWLVASDGGVFAFGDAGYYGSIPGTGLHPAGSGLPHSLNAPIVGMVPSSDGGGYFMVATDGGVFAFGDARFEGSCPGMGGCSGAAVSVVPDATGNGYWLITQTGSVYAFGDAPFYGAPGNQGSPVTSAVRTADGHGYWVLLANGAVFAYGDATPYGGPVGSVGGFNPASAIFSDATGGGYWVASSQGAVYAYGDAPNDGSMAGSHLNGSIIAASGF